MKCNEARRMVVPFVKHELSEREMEKFLAHAENCTDCMDELETYFMVYHALDAMDSGERHEYDFKKMLEEEIHASRRTIWMRKAANIGRVVILTAAEAMLLLCIFVGVRMKQGTVGNSIFERALLRMHIERMNDAEEILSETETETESLQAEETDTTQAVTEADMAPDGTSEVTDSSVETADTEVSGMTGGEP